MSIIRKTFNYSPGDVFYYKSNNKTYGGVFLYRQQDLGLRGFVRNWTGESLVSLICLPSTGKIIIVSLLLVKMERAWIIHESF